MTEVYEQLEIIEEDNVSSKNIKQKRGKSITIFEKEIFNKIVEITHNFGGEIFGGAIISYLRNEPYNDIDIALSETKIKEFINFVGIMFGRKNIKHEMVYFNDYGNNILHYKLKITHKIGVCKYTTKIDIVNIESVENQIHYDFDITSLIMYKNGIKVKDMSKYPWMMYEPSLVLKIIDNIKLKKFTPIIPFNNYKEVLPIQKTSKFVLRARKLINKGWVCTEEIPCKIYKGYEIFNETQEIGEEFNCTICLELMGDNDDIIKTICDHTFHAKCILNYIISTVGDIKCPLCNTKNDSINRTFIEGI